MTGTYPVHQDLFYCVLDRHFRQETSQGQG